MLVITIDSTMPGHNEITIESTTNSAVATVRVWAVSCATGAFLWARMSSERAIRSKSERKRQSEGDTTLWWQRQQRRNCSELIIRCEMRRLDLLFENNQSGCTAALRGRHSARAINRMTVITSTSISHSLTKWAISRYSETEAPAYLCDLVLELGQLDVVFVSPFYWCGSIQNTCDQHTHALFSDSTKQVDAVQ